MPHLRERPRVLVVDDEPFIRAMLTDFLLLEGYDVRTAEDGQAALEEVLREPYDLVLSDLKMPRLGGIELLDAMAIHVPNTITVIMTGFGTVETAIDAMKRGAYDYILKPFRTEEVLRVVHRGLEKRRLQNENLRLREAVSLYAVSEAIAASLSLDEVLHTLGSVAEHDVGGDVVSVWLEDGAGGYSERLRRVRANDEAAANFGSFEAGAFIEHFKGSPFVLAHGTNGAHFCRDRVVLESMLAVPLYMKARLLGWVAAASVMRTKRFDEGQRKLLAIVASRSAAAIENARLYEDLRATFKQTISGLAKAIDKMDRYTAGHSERVATYADYLGRRLGLPEDTLEVVRQSALMHDIGKIGCAMNLNKPAKLTTDEYEVFKRHPTYGKDILEPITFLHPLIAGVHLHHERWDGRGYPLGLKGNDVPIIARIVSVADTYDAMTSDRAYRRALPHEVAIGEIERCSGSQFDPSVATHFTEGIELFREELASRGERVPE
jgi:response regulator RpfG family c-di-GMP phosphodiesterase